MKQHRALLGMGLVLACMLTGAVLASAASALPLCAEVTVAGPDGSRTTLA
jgi:hypothetical protein